MVNISQVTPVTIQNKNHLEIIPLFVHKIGNMVEKYQCNTFNTI